MNYTTLQYPAISRKRNESRIEKFAKSKRGLIHRAGKNPLHIIINPLFPAEILDAKWTDWNEPDIIKFRSISGKIFLIQNEDLLEEICGYLRANGRVSRAPYLHLKGCDGWICIPKPQNSDLLDYLSTNFGKYDIYSEDGELVK